MWLTNCEHTIETSIENLHKNYCVCGKHFRESMFLNNLKNRLQPHAVPISLADDNSNKLLISNNEMSFSSSNGE